MNNTVLKFDKVILTKAMNDKFKKVGEVYEIASVSENSFLLRDFNNKVAVGIVRFEDFDKYFVKEELKGWTPWTPFVGALDETDIFYRTNGKKVQVRSLRDKVRAEASCNKMDEFNLFFGLQIAYMRCENKAMLKRKAKYEKEVKRLDSEIKDNKDYISRMINSLEN